MTSIEAIEIAGIRSFAPDPPQTIKFFKPLTVIVGDNGCGKTTIIESLKFATTGEYPDNSERGQAFVHDPRLAGAQEVKARVRLRFKSRTAEGPRIYEVTRLLQVTQSRKKATLKQLDGVLTVKNEKGDVIERLNQRCTDLSKTVPVLLGISAAILDNVVFCHQEDSNWPMQDGAALKKKFDDVFESTRYSKALDDVRKKRKSLMEDVKGYKAELDVLKAHQEMSQVIKGEIAEKEDQLQTLVEKCKELRGSVDEAEKKEGALLAKISAAEGKRSELERLRGQLQSAIEDQRKAHEVLVRENLADKVDDSDGSEELLAQIKLNLSELDAKVVQKQRAIGDLRTKKVRHDDELNRKSKDKGRLEEAAKHLDNIARQFADKAKEVSTQFGIASLTGPVTVETSTRLLAELDAVHVKEKEALRRAREDRKQAMDAVDGDTNRAKLALQKAKDDLTAKQKLLRRVTEELRSLQSGLKSSPEVRAAARRVEDARERLRRAEAAIAAFNPQTDMPAVLAEKDSLTRLVTDLKSRLLALETARAKQAQLESKKAAVGSAWSTIKPRVQRLLGRAGSPGDVREAVVKALNTSKIEMGLKEKDAAGKGADLAQLLGQMESLKQSKALVEGEKRALEDGPLRACRDDFGDIIDISEDLRSLKAEDAKLEISQSNLKSFSDVILRFSKYLEEKHVCMACDRAFATAAELATAKQTLAALKEKPDKTGASEKSSKLLAVKADIAAAEANLEAYRTWVLKKETLTNLDSRIDELLPKSKALYDEKSAADEALALSREKVSLGNSLLPEAVAIERDFAELTTLEQEIEELGAAGPSESSESEEADLVGQLKRAEEKLDRLSRVQQDADSRRLDLDRERMDARHELSQLEAASKLSTEKDQLERETSALSASIPSLEEDVAACEARRDDMARQCDRSMDSAAQRVAICAGLHSALGKLVTDLRDAEGNNPRARLADVLREEGRIKADSEELSAQIKAMEAELQATITSKAELLEAHAHIEYIQRYRQAVSRREAIDAQMAQLHRQMQNQMSDGELDSVESELTVVRSSLIGLRGRYSKLKGSIETYNVDLKERRLKLKDPKYEDIDERCREVMISHETGQLAAADLDRYYKALDAALTHYHDLKIKEINDLIKGLWTNTYKGMDIESIEIRSNVMEEDGGEEAAAAATKKRNFNYRVVMMKGDTELNMKGRCSAGQKVLASLVIRLALAESFCLSCGILALDEPTTNLDQENKDGLAKAIADILDAKRTQSNFQLIVITHEIEFVQMLARHMEGGGAGPTGSHYFLVGRDETTPGKYRSKIVRQEYGDMIM